MINQLIATNVIIKPPNSYRVIQNALHPLTKQHNY